MRNLLLPALAALCTLASFPPAQAASECIAYGNEETSFTWLLCPRGRKYERQYLYFGFWSKFYEVNSSTGECDWAAYRSSWVCPGRTIHCGLEQCG